jgi:hypothetical protein
MPEAAKLLSEWENFYVIVGSSAAALTGLMFVVIALIADSPLPGSTPRSIAAFSTPTIVHFCAALLASVILSAPWHAIVNAYIALGVTGSAGVVYTVVVLNRARHTTEYRPVAEDWIWHVIFPLGAYLTVAGAAVLFHDDVHLALFAVAGAVVLLIFIGIHNSWDTVTFIVEQRMKRQAKEGRQ